MQKGKQRGRAINHGISCLCRSSWLQGRRNVIALMPLPQQLTLCRRNVNKAECAAAATVGGQDAATSFVEIAAAATAGQRDAATSNSSRTAAAATAGERDTETSRTTNRSPRTPTKPPRCIEPESKETGVTAGNKRKSSVPVFLHRPGSRRLASGRIRQNVHNLVSFLPPTNKKF